MMRNTFQGDPRPSLSRWRAQAGRYQIELGKFDCTLMQRKETNKLLLSKNLATSSKAKKCGASCEVHSRSRNNLVTNFILDVGCSTCT